MAAKKKKGPSLSVGRGEKLPVSCSLQSISGVISEIPDRLLNNWT